MGTRYSHIDLAERRRIQKMRDAKLQFESALGNVLIGSPPVVIPWCALRVFGEHATKAGMGSPKTRSGRQRDE